MFKVYSMTEIDDKNQSQNNYYINKLWFNVSLTRQCVQKDFSRFC